MLNRHINIPANLVAGIEGFQQFQWKFCRICVHQPYPDNPLDLREFPHELREHPLAVQIKTVIRTVLRDNDKFLYAKSGQSSGLKQNPIHRLAHMHSAHDGDRAERTWVIAPLGDFQIRKMLGSGEMAFSEEFILILPAE